MDSQLARDHENRGGIGGQLCARTRCKPVFPVCAGAKMFFQVQPIIRRVSRIQPGYRYPGSRNKRNRTCAVRSRARDTRVGPAIACAKASLLGPSPLQAVTTCNTLTRNARTAGIQPWRMRGRVSRSESASTPGILSGQSANVGALALIGYGGSDLPLR